MAYEPINYVSVHGIAVAFFAMGLFAGLVISRLREDSEEETGAASRERDEFDVEGLPRYEEESPPDYEATFGRRDASSIVPDTKHESKSFLVA